MVAPGESLRRPLRFLVVGVANTLLDIALFLVLTAVGLPVIPANMISTGIALVFSFVLNRSYTFRAGPGVVRQAIGFVVVTLVGLWLLQPIVLHFMLLWLEPLLPTTAALLVAKVIATVVSLTWNYLLYNFVVFRAPSRGESR